LGDLQSLGGVGKHEQGKIGGRDRLRGKTPEVEIVSLQFGKSIAVIIDPDFRFPASTGCDCHCKRRALGGVRKVFVSTGRRQPTSSRVLAPLAVAWL